MELNDLTEKIIGAAHKVLFALKPGLAFCAICGKAIGFLTTECTECVGVRK